MKIFLSSTYTDLVAHRKATTEALERLGQQIERMEIFGARPEEPSQACLAEVEQCNVFIGIYAHRYGYIPEKSNISITEMELNHARELGRPIFCFVIEDDHPWPPSMIEGEPGQSKLKALKKELNNHYVRDSFTTPADLAVKVATSIGRYLTQYGSSATSLAWEERLEKPFSEQDIVQVPFIKQADTNLVPIPCVMDSVRQEDSRQAVLSRIGEYFRERQRRELEVLERIWAETKRQLVTEEQSRKLKREEATERARHIFDDLRQEEFRALRTPPLWILVIGDTGSGKSTLASEIARSVGAVFVDLRNYSTSLEKLIGESKQKASRGFSNTQPPKILVLDALDKMVPGATYVNTIECLREIRQTVSAYDAIVLTARANFFRSTPEEILREATLLKLLPLDYESILLFAEKQNVHRTLESAMTHEPTIRELAANPLLLSMLAGLIKSGYEIVDIRDQEALFSRVTDKWLDRDTGDSIIPKDQRMKCMQHLAIQALGAGGKSFGYKTIDATGLAVLGQTNPEILERFSTDLRVCGFLRQVYPGEFEFYHAAFYEYCVSRTIFEDIRNKEFFAIEGHPFTLDIVEFARKRAERKKIVDDLMITILDAWECQLNGIARANLLLLYVHLGGKVSDLTLDGKEISRQSFHGLHFKDIHASNVVLTECSFNNVDFENLHANRWHIQRCLLHNCLFRNARFDEVIIDQTDLQVGHRCRSYFYFCRMSHCRLILSTTSQVLIQGGRLADTALGFDGPDGFYQTKSAKRLAKVRCVVIENLKIERSLACWRVEECSVDPLSQYNISELPQLQRPSLSKAIASGVSAWKSHPDRVAWVVSPKAHVGPNPGLLPTDEPLSKTQLRKKNLDEYKRRFQPKNSKE